MKYKTLISVTLESEASAEEVGQKLFEFLEDAEEKMGWSVDELAATDVTGMTVPSISHRKM